MDRYLLLSTKDVTDATALARQHNLNNRLSDETLATLGAGRTHIIGHFRVPHYHAAGKLADLPHYRCQVALTPAKGESFQQFLDIPTSILDRALMVEAELREGAEPLVQRVEGIRLQAPWNPADRLRDGRVDADGNLSGITVGPDGISLDDVTLHAPDTAAALEQVPEEERPALLRKLIEEGARLMQVGGMDDDRPTRDDFIPIDPEVAVKAGMVLHEVEKSTLWADDPKIQDLRGAAMIGDDVLIPVSEVERIERLGIPETQREIDAMEAKLVEMQGAVVRSRAEEARLRRELGELQLKLREMFEGPR